MVVQHNINALNAWRQLVGNNTAVGKNTEKLSSGYRINRAGDDAAGLAISEKMRGQIRGLDMAARNANDGISLIQTAEGALNETHSILQRMRELAVQSSNGIYQQEDRDNLQLEVDELKKEIDRIADSTEFNKIKLLNGSSGDATVSKMTGTFGSTQLTFSFGVKGLTSEVGLATDDSGTAGGITVTVDATTGNIGITLGDDAEFNYSTSVIETIVKAQIEAQYQDTLSTYLALPANSGKTEADFRDSTTNTANVNLVKLYDARSTFSISGAKSIATDGAGTFEVASAALANGAGSGSGITFQIGANGTTDQRVTLNIDNMKVAALGVSGVDISTQTEANAAIDLIDGATNLVSKQRAGLGALQNRLEHTVNNLQVASENLTAAESRIRDVDMAKEMMALTKNNILVQASQAMLAQANQQPQGVLQLLR